MPESSGAFFKAEPRNAIVRPVALRLTEPRRDELNDDCLAADLAFELPRGAYATLLVKRVFPG